MISHGAILFAMKKNSIHQLSTAETLPIIFKKWLPLAVITTGLCFTSYILVQQSLRLSANDPQVQLAEDAVSQINARLPVSLGMMVDMNQSLAPFVTIYDQHQQVISSTGVLDGIVPKIPAGVLARALARGSDRVTWQPRSGVRIAAVVMSSHSGFVVAGRNLREVEHREDQALKLMILGWLALLGTSFATVLIMEIIWPSPYRE